MSITNDKLWRNHIDIGYIQLTIIINKLEKNV